MAPWACVPSRSRTARPLTYGTPWRCAFVGDSHPTTQHELHTAASARGDEVEPGVADAPAEIVRGEVVEVEQAR